MPTTTNFGWTTPADTDLVKDGAAAIRTLGNGVDTSFLDLKGGTTGQVLSKNSNTDLDFTWIAADDTTLDISAKTGTTYTFALVDQPNILITASNAASQTYSIPTNASVAFPIGSQINIIQIGAGQVTINAVTSGTTTVLSTGATAAAPKLRAQYSAATCIKVGTDTWYVVGDIA
jgi:hypothetical protein